MDLAADVAFAQALADEADAVTLARFGAADLLVDTKPDLTPVSDADRTVEQLLRRRLGEERPRDAVLGEEYGDEGAGPRRWVLDPIDGTKNFVRGVPVWATLIALRVADDRAPAGAETALGVVSAPALGRRWWAARGHGSWTRFGGAPARRLAVSGVRRLADASLSYSSLSGWAARQRLPGFLQLAGSVWRTRAYGDFWSHALVAEGAVDVSCEPDVTLWDLAALHVLVEEAGGCFSDLDGRPGPAGGSVVCSNGALHAQVVAVLASR